jgi:hypothetical protein
MQTTMDAAAAVRSFTFDGFQGLCPMRASGTINGLPWAYRLEPGRESLAVDGQFIASLPIPEGVLCAADDYPSVFAAEQIEFIVQRLLRWAKEAEA